MSKQHSTLSKESFDLQHSTMLLRHCCWCGRGFTVVVENVHMSCVERSQAAEHDACCGGMLTVMSWFLVLLTLPWSLCMCLKVGHSVVTAYNYSTLYECLSGTDRQARVLGGYYIKCVVMLNRSAVLSSSWATVLSCCGMLLVSSFSAA